MPSIIELIGKYNTAVPRYTSYPTVPCWNPSSFSIRKYLDILSENIKCFNEEGISIYIHLPFCESLCTYCGCNTRITVNHAVEAPYIDAVLREWALYRAFFEQKPRIREIHLGGGTPTFFAAAQLQRLLQGLLADSEVCADASFSFEAHPASTTLEHLKVLSQIGFDRLSLGVQDFDPVVQHAINRKQTAEDVERVSAQARALGYRSVNFDLVYGLPFQTLDGVSDAVQKVIEMLPDRIAFYSYAHVPWMRPGQRAYSEGDLPDPEAKLRLFTTGRELLTNAGYESIGFDHFALPHDSLYKAYIRGEVHRNFMGYTDRKTSCLLGLGVSSISDAGSAYAQNTKSVEQYIQLTAQGEWPIAKGHCLNQEQIRVRRHILNLTCTQTTAWNLAEKEEIGFVQRQLPALKAMEADGVLVLGNEALHLTELGRIFVRNVCAVLDPEYKDHEVKPTYAAAV